MPGHKKWSDIKKEALKRRAINSNVDGDKVDQKKEPQETCVVSAQNITCISVTEFKKDFDRYMERVAAGERFIITFHRKKVAVLVSQEEYKKLTKNEAI